jgi:hypothetical protein
LLSKCIDTDEIGKVFSILAVVASVAPIGGNPVFRQLYNSTLNVFPGAVFLLFAALFFLAGTVNLFLYFMRDKINNDDSPEVEKEGNLGEKEKESSSVHTEVSEF